MNPGEEVVALAAKDDWLKVRMAPAAKEATGGGLGDDADDDASDSAGIAWVLHWGPNGREMLRPGACPTKI